MQSTTIKQRRTISRHFRVTRGVDFCFARASADAALPMGSWRLGAVWKFLRSIAENYDLVIVDTSSLSSSNEARAAFRLADAAILVLRTGQTSQPKLDEALAAASPPSDLRHGFRVQQDSKAATVQSNSNRLV